MCIRDRSLFDRRLGDDLGMTDRVTTVLVDVRVQALEIVIEDAFVTFHVSVELVGVGTSTEEGVRGLSGRGSGAITGMAGSAAR